MTLDPLLNAPLQVQIHVFAALLALFIGPVSIWRKRRDLIHKSLGVLWNSAMLVVATTAFFIHEIRWIGPFSPIHLFSFMTYYYLWQAITHLRARRFQAHGAAMKSLYFNALVVAGVFTILPGRRMNEVLFADYGVEGFVAALTLSIMALLWARRRRRAVVTHSVSR